MQSKRDTQFIFFLKKPLRKMDTLLGDAWEALALTDESAVEKVERITMKKPLEVVA
jgi:hypothetical protein